MASFGVEIPSVGLVILTMVFKRDSIYAIIVSFKNKAFDAEVFNDKKQPKSKYKKIIWFFLPCELQQFRGFFSIFNPNISSMPLFFQAKFISFAKLYY